MLNDLLRYCEAERDWALETILALAGLESPTGDKAAVDRCGGELAKRLREIGGVVNRLEQPSAGDHLRAEFGAGAGQVLLVGHFDTVWPVGQIERMPLDLRDGCLFGPGVFDMKGGIAIGMLAVRALKRLNALPGRVVMLWTSDEERGSSSSRQVIEQEALRSHAVFVLEPSLPGGAVKTARKGCGEFLLKVQGVAAHAGVEPDQGASAVHELAAQIIDLQRLRKLVQGASLNVGVISGGTRPNMVAEEASATVDVRVDTAEEANQIETLLRQRIVTVPGTRLEVAGAFNRPPLERSDAVIKLYGRAREIAFRLGHDLGEGHTGGGSDGNFTAALGIPTLDGLGAVGAGAHALHEHIEVADLPWRAALLAALMSETQTEDCEL